MERAKRGIEQLRKNAKYAFERRGRAAHNLIYGS